MISVSQLISFQGLKLTSSAILYAIMRGDVDTDFFSFYRGKLAAFLARALETFRMFCSERSSLHRYGVVAALIYIF